MNMSTSSSESTISRKVHFFSWKPLRGIGNTARLVNAVSVMKAVNAIPWNSENPGRYLGDTRDTSKETALLGIEIVGEAVHGQIAHIRRNARPHFEKRGTGVVQVISELEKEDGIAEITHFILYPNEGVLAMEYNFHGPKCSTLANYLPRKASSLINRIEWDYIVSTDFRTRLEEFRHEGISRAEIRIVSSRIHEIESIDTSVYKAAKAIRGLGDPEVVDIKIGPRSRSGSKIDIIENIRRLGSAVFPGPNLEPLTAITGFKVTAESNNSGQQKAFDLLEEDLVAEIQVVKQEETRTINSKDMFEKIHKAFLVRKSELREALGKVDHETA